MLPVLKSQDRIHRAQDIALGNGALPEEDSSALREDLVKAAQLNPSRPEGPPPTRKDLDGMGIGVRVAQAEGD